jgi:hypothetical protein
MFFGRSRCATKRTSGLSMPMPNAMVATITSPSSRRKRSWWRLRTSASSPAWYGSAAMPSATSHSAVLLDLLARLAVHDAGIAVVLVLDEAQQLRARVVLLDDRVADVGPVEAADEDARVLELQALDDVGARQVVGGGRQRDARHAA